MAQRIPLSKAGTRAGSVHLDAIDWTDGRRTYSATVYDVLGNLIVCCSGSDVDDVHERGWQELEGLTPGEGGPGQGHGEGPEAAISALLAQHGDLANAQRNQRDGVLKEVLLFLRRSEAEWTRLEGVQGWEDGCDAVIEGRQLHERQLCELFAVIGGAL